MNLQELNKEQRKAAETLEGPVLVLAGAGSGKTKMLTYRVANLIAHGVPPHSIMAITFTNKAAQEMRERIELLIGDKAKEVWLSTFHSGCAKILRRDIDKIGYSRSFAIYDDSDQDIILKEVLNKLNLDPKQYPINQIKSIISHAKEKLLNPQEWFEKSRRGFFEQQIQDIFVLYEERLKKSNALDFNDLIGKTLELFLMHPPVLEYYQTRLKYIHVDEYQDTDYAQYMLVSLLSQKSRNLCVVGDDDQSIYGWRGADVKNILDFEKDFPDAKVIKLEQNYRSSANILNAANQVISSNINRKDKALWTKRDDGEKIKLYEALDERDEALYVGKMITHLISSGQKLSDTAILYRTHAQSRIFEEVFIQSGLRYRIYGGLRFYDRKEIKDILAYLRIIVNPTDDVSLKRIINTPKRGIGDATVELLSAQGEKEGVPLLSVCMDPPDSLSLRSRNKIVSFSQMILDFQIKKDILPLDQLIKGIIDTTGLKSQYEQGKTEEDQGKVDNINELLNSVSEFMENGDDISLQSYVENVALVSNFDQIGDDSGAITMMTLHGAKGLEFPNVFMVGMEENVFPSYRSITDEDPDKMEEERRLCYVGITRAENRLFMSYARSRRMYNQISYNNRSRFLDDIPIRLIEKESCRDRNSVPSLDQSVNIMHSAPYNHPVNNKKNMIGKGSDSTSRYLGATSNSSIQLGGRTIQGVSQGFSNLNVRNQKNDFPTENLFSEGDWVVHRKFGKGKIVQINGEGRNMQAVIAFADGQIKTLALSIAPLIKINSNN